MEVLEEFTFFHQQCIKAGKRDTYAFISSLGHNIQQSDIEKNCCQKLIMIFLSVNFISKLEMYLQHTYAPNFQTVSQIPKTITLSKQYSTYAIIHTLIYFIVLSIFLWMQLHTQVKFNILTEENNSNIIEIINKQTPSA